MFRILLVFAAFVVGGCALGQPLSHSAVDTATGQTRDYIVSSNTVEQAIALVESSGGTVVAQFEIIDAVTANLTINQVRDIEQQPELGAILEDRQLTTDGANQEQYKTQENIAGSTGADNHSVRSVKRGVLQDASAKKRQTRSSSGAAQSQAADARGVTNYLHKFSSGALRAHYMEHTGVETLHRMGLTGESVTIAVIDSGIWDSMRFNSVGHRLVTEIDTTGNSVVEGKKLGDGSGHGTHVASIIACNGFDLDFRREGVAPGANIVSVKAFDADGRGTYTTVIRAIDWVVENRDRHDIRILNLSFSAAPSSFYWDDPLNEAVQAAWDSGIVVVASAGNQSSGNYTIGVPGNLPAIVTVGASTDSFTPENPSDDRVTSFSSTGPTAAGFVKPDVIAPGGHVIGRMDTESKIALSQQDSVLDRSVRFAMSGTSQAAAIVSGIAALMLEADPSLTPDAIK